MAKFRASPRRCWCGLIVNGRRQHWCHYCHIPWHPKDVGEGLLKIQPVGSSIVAKLKEKINEVVLSAICVSGGPKIC